MAGEVKTQEFSEGVVVGTPTDIDRATSQIRADTGNGHGSTNTKIRRFTNNVTTGSNITFNQSAADGDDFTVNVTGVYAISYTDGGGTSWVGISVNSAQLTTNIFAITTANRLMSAESNGGIVINVAVTVRLTSGDVIRAHTDGDVTDVSARSQFVITQVALT